MFFFWGGGFKLTVTFHFMVALIPHFICLQVFGSDILFFISYSRECDEGKEPVFVNNRYRCPEHPPCGEHPNCVVGRKGSDCSQPDVQPCPCEC